MGLEFPSYPRYHKPTNPFFNFLIVQTCRFSGLARRSRVSPLTRQKKKPGNRKQIRTSQRLLLLLAESYPSKKKKKCPFSPHFSSSSLIEQNIPYLANTLGSVPWASRSIIGVWGLFFFMVGYALMRKDLFILYEYPLREGSNSVSPKRFTAVRIRKGNGRRRGTREAPNLVAALCSEV